MTTDDDDVTCIRRDLNEDKVEATFVEAKSKRTCFHRGVIFLLKLNSGLDE